MAAQTSPTSRSITSEDAGPIILALAGVLTIGYGIMFIIWNFAYLIEWGLGVENVGVTADQIRAISPSLYHYISHVQTALGAFIIGLGICVTALAWFGIRSGHWWAWWAAFLGSVIAIGIALPLHYMYGFATLARLGLVYIDVLIFLIGAALSYRRLRSMSSEEKG